VALHFCTTVSFCMIYTKINQKNHKWNQNKLPKVVVDWNTNTTVTHVLQMKRLDFVFPLTKTTFFTYNKTILGTKLAYVSRHSSVFILKTNFLHINPCEFGELPPSISFTGAWPDNKTVQKAAQMDVDLTVTWILFLFYSRRMIGSHACISFTGARPTIPSHGPEIRRLRQYHRMARK
jgi:hypothetical protein